MNKEQYLITIKAEDRPGLLHLITGTIEKRQGQIKTLTFAQTDIHGVVFVTAEISIKENQLTPLAFKLEHIIEVLSVEAAQHNKVVCLRAAYFRLAKDFLDTPGFSVLQKHNSVIVSWDKDAFVVAHHGNDSTVRDLYNQLDGTYLHGFSQNGLISESSLKDNDREGRVMTGHEHTVTPEWTIRLAA